MKKDDLSIKAKKVHMINLHNEVFWAVFFVYGLE